MKRFSCILLWCLALAAPLSASDDDVCPATEVWQAYQLGFGPTQLLDTYLSQEKFSGTGLTFLSSSERYSHNAVASEWHTLIEHQLSLATADDRSGLRNELQGDYSCYVGRTYNWQACTWHDNLGALYLQAGAMLGGNLGFIYNTSNSNNPAQARASLSLMPVVGARCRVRLFSHPLHVRYALQLPLAGVAFSPNYGQSYYEMFSLGNYDHNIVPTTFVSAPSFRQQLSLDYWLWEQSCLRIGYLGDYQQLQVNNLKSHVVHHRIMVGYVHHFSHRKSLKKKTQ